MANSDPAGATARGAPRCQHCVTGTNVPVRTLWQKTCTAYAVLRAVRLLQARRVLPGGGGLVVAGVHVHHFVHGFALVLAQQVLARRPHSCLHRPLRANLLGTGAALVLDELDVLTGTQHSAGADAVRVALDTTGVLGAALGAVDAQRTWSGWYPDRWSPWRSLRP